ncbi:3-deoxy-D-manno-octulosonic acid transferase [Paracraurococcus lichenis]|uniref:3-deoxy-D-manno-octulosonic acid transferase n=1 Tax=Paracraurococcus lichenis TaxID=3064888 RepID=A0ABT9E215_9PROT|nr:glycosyltransferase N-terminal domain-containing protein [Paracraurococcus sp. LOR1-02]MDO9710201.1 glycosyltransferase N-terminal domain-containing protein [Paracraurococcus sp. LOR1-02]
MSAALALWRLAAKAAAPLLPLHLGRRVRRGKEVAGRLGERRGEGAARPPGRLLWLHAASVGETLSVIPLLEALAARAPDLTILVTTGTVTAAGMLAQRLPDALGGRLLHRFVPLDVPAWVGRFLEGWRPDLGVMVESELWPNMIAAAAAQGVPLALVNARFSARSARRWRLAPGLGRRLIGAFRLVTAQSAADAARLRALGAGEVLTLGNLKDAAPPLPADAAALAALRQAIGGRPVFLAASTHPGEEAILAAAHPLLAAAHPGLLTVIVPRHPERGAVIAADLAPLPTARRAAGALPGPGTAVYVADTLGELGLFYRLARVCLVGGSLVPHGGQNPREPARLGCPILLGPHCWNFEEPVARLLAAGGALRVSPDPAALAAAAGDVLSDANRGRRMAEAAAAALAAEAGLPDRLAGLLIGLLPGAGPGEGAAMPALAGPAAAPGQPTGSGSGR